MANERLQSSGFVDPELGTLLAKSAQCMSPQGFDALLAAEKRFNKPTRVPDGPTIHSLSHIDNNYSLRHLLMEVPVCMESSRAAGIAQEDAESLITHLLTANSYDFQDNQISVSLLASELRQTAQRGEVISSSDLQDIRRLISVGGKYGYIAESINAYGIARQLGISTGEGVSLILSMEEPDGSLSGETFPHFTDALKSFLGGAASPTTIVEVLRIIGGKRPYFNKHIYDLLQDAILFDCTARRIMPQQFLEAFLVGNNNHGEDFEQFLQIYSRQIAHFDNKVEVLDSTDKERYFPAKPDALAHRGLPYQVRRSLQDGLEDLEKLALSSVVRYEEVAEGFWTFDPASQTWYSFGGKTEAAIGRVRHSIIPYDISKLSNTPILVHIHPKELEGMIRPFFDRESFQEAYAEHIMRFFVATPSRSDFLETAELIEEAARHTRSRSLIVSSLGITEYTYPDKVEEIKRVSTVSREIRDQAVTNVMERLFAETVSVNFGRKGMTFDVLDEETTVKLFLEEFNKLLPEDFHIVLHPPGTRVQ